MECGIPNYIKQLNWVVYTGVSAGNALIDSIWNNIRLKLVSDSVNKYQINHIG